MIAVVAVRRGTLPAGAEEAAAEAGGRALLAGDGVAAAADALTSAAEVLLWEAGEFRPAAFAAVLAPALADEDVVVLPASPDGRDLAPRLAAALGRPLIANAVIVRPDLVVAARYDGRVAERTVPSGPLVVTLVPGVRGLGPPPPDRVVRELPVPAAGAGAGAPHDAEVLAVLPADPATIALTEAERIVAGGAGLGSPEVFAELADVAAGLGASLGATRVVADLGWIPFERQIGTTGAVVSPALYLAFGISGAVQHTAGLGSPAHVIAVNTDGSAPMMAMADLAIVADAPAVVAELRKRLVEDAQ